MKTCPYCGRENEDSTEQCKECGVAIPTLEPTDSRLTDPDQNLVVVAEFDELVEASLLKDRLEQAGIEACIPEELNPSPFANTTALSRVTVRVAKKDLEAARSVVETPAVEPQKPE
jgi:hypothetical protein